MTPKPKVGVGALIIQDGRILLAKRKGSHDQRTYGSVGGHLEFGESPKMLSNVKHRKSWASDWGI